MTIKLALPPPSADPVQNYRQQMQGALMEVGFWQSCLNCEHWSNNSVEHRNDPPVDKCRKWDVCPPPTVITIGCDRWLAVVPF